MFKPTKSRKAEFDDWWDGFLNEQGATPKQKAEIIRQSEEFKQRSAEYCHNIEQKASEGRIEGESLEDFKKRKLKSLDILANAVNELYD